MPAKLVKVLVCRVGRRPVVETIDGGIDAMQALVAGPVQMIVLDDGVELWSNEEALLWAMPLNRAIPAAPRSAPTLGGEPVEIIYADEGLAQPGEPGEWRIFGDFFLASTDTDGELADVSDEAITKYTALFDAEDIIAAKRMNDIRTADGGYDADR